MKLTAKRTHTRFPTRRNLMRFGLPTGSEQRDLFGNTLIPSQFNFASNFGPHETPNRNRIWPFGAPLAAPFTGNSEVFPCAFAPSGVEVFLSSLEAKHANHSADSRPLLTPKTPKSASWDAPCEWAAFCRFCML